MNNSTDQARTLLEGAKDILIALPANPSFDSVASALSLYLGLSSRGSQVSLVCPDEMTVEFSHLVGVDRITNNISSGAGKNLVISFPYQEGSIEKVSYNIENDTFNLVIEPREGYPMVTQDVIRFATSGGNTDLVITVGAAQLTDLGNLYQNNQGLFAEKPVLNIDTNNQNTRFGRVNLVDPNVSSVSELTISLLSNIGIPMNADIATNLLAGVNMGTNNLTSEKTQASTYEAAAMCMRSGGRKITLPTGVPLQQPQPFKPVKPAPFMPQPVQQQFNKPVMGGKQPLKPKPFTPTQPTVQQPQQQPPQPQKKQTGEAPPDWLKPKIYKGSTLL